MLREGVEHNVRIGADLVAAVQLEFLPCGEREQCGGENGAANPLQAPDHRPGGEHAVPGIGARQTGQTAQHGRQESEENGHVDNVCRL